MNFTMVVCELHHELHLDVLAAVFFFFGTELRHHVSLNFQHKKLGIWELQKKIGN